MNTNEVAKIEKVMLR